MRILTIGAVGRARDGGVLAGLRNGAGHRIRVMTAVPRPVSPPWLNERPLPRGLEAPVLAAAATTDGTTQPATARAALHPGTDREIAADIEVVGGDLEDRPSLRAALDGCDAVFAWLEGFEDAAALRRQGRNLINAVAGSEIDYFVLTTSLGATLARERSDLERYARSLGLPATFLRLPPHHSISAATAIVARLFADPAAFVGTTVDA